MSELSTLTIEGPSQTASGVDTVYGGRLVETVSGSPIPNKKLRIVLNGSPVAYPVTDSDGRFTFLANFSTTGLNHIQVDYLAVGLLGTPPPDEYCVREGDSVMRTCLGVDPVSGIQTRVDVDTWVCQAGKWVETGKVCEDASTVIEPCVCYDGDNEKHLCAVGDDMGYVARFWCKGDKWNPLEGYCTPSEAPIGPCTLCDAIWKDCDGYVQPSHTCDAYETMVPTNLPCPRPTPEVSYQDLLVPNLASPTYVPYQTFTMQQLSVLGDLVAFHLTTATGVNAVCVIDVVHGTYTYYTYPGKSADGIVSYNPQGVVLVSPTEAWAFESVRGYSSTSGDIRARLIKLSLSGKVATVTEQHLLGAQLIGRGGAITKLASGGVAVSWYDYLTQKNTQVGVAYVSPTGEVDINYPIVVTEPMGSMAAAWHVMGQDPADESLWLFYHRDSFSTIGAVRLVEGSSGLDVVSKNYAFVPQTSEYRVYGEFPRLQTLVADGRLYLDYPTMYGALCVRCDDDIKTSLFRFVQLDVGSGASRATRPCSPWNAAFGFGVSPTGVPWMLAFPPIKTTRYLPHLIIPDVEGWETAPAPFDTLANSIVGLAYSKERMVIRCADGFHVLSVL